MAIDSSRFPIGQKVMLPGHFEQAVTLEGVRPLGRGFECRVRLSNGSLDETVISEEEAHILLGDLGSDPTTIVPADAEQVRLLIESARIRLCVPGRRCPSGLVCGAPSTSRRTRMIAVLTRFWNFSLESRSVPRQTSSKKLSRSFGPESSYVSASLNSL